MIALTKKKQSNNKNEPKKQKKSGIESAGSDLKKETENRFDSEKRFFQKIYIIYIERQREKRVEWRKRKKKKKWRGVWERREGLKRWSGRLRFVPTFEYRGCGPLDE